jgi:hypothetical protein
MPSNPIPRYLPGSNSYAQVGSRAVGRPARLPACPPACLPACQTKAIGGLGPTQRGSLSHPSPCLCCAVRIAACCTGCAVCEELRGPVA